jgi:hypothetical protein
MKECVVLEWLQVNLARESRKRDIRRLISSVQNVTQGLNDQPVPKNPAAKKKKPLFMPFGIEFNWTRTIFSPRGREPFYNATLQRKRSLHRV